MQRGDLDRLDDIVAAADDIAIFLASIDIEAFITEKSLRYAVLYALAIIGEAANRMSDELRERNNEVAWRRIIAFRHRLVHGYGELDLVLVWEVANRLVPELRRQAETIRSELTMDGD